MKSLRETSETRKMLPVAARPPKPRTRNKIVILSLWFVSLIGVRLLFGLVLSHVWVGTIGAVAVTFLLFYFTLKFTPLSRYANTVSSVLQSWYNKKFVLAGIVSSMAILTTMMFLVEFGYTYHAESVTALSELDDMNFAERAHVERSFAGLMASGHSGFDALSIVIASVDKSLDGYYLKLLSLTLGENIEILAFLVIINRVGERSLFQLFVRSPRSG